MTEQDIDDVDWLDSPRLDKPKRGGTEILPPTTADLLSLAKRLFAARERRRHFLSEDLFGEPAWDMLLALFAASLSGHRMTVSHLCTASGVPPTTALRWLDTLRDKGLTRRLKNPLDGRVIFVEMEPEGRARMTAYLENIWFRYFPH